MIRKPKAATRGNKYFISFFRKNAKVNPLGSIFGIESSANEPR
jgi:hypothetical protein